MSGFPYQPGSEVERQRLAAQVAAEDAAAEAERVAALPPAEEPVAPQPGLSDAERAELEQLRAERANQAYQVPDEEVQNES